MALYAEQQNFPLVTIRATNVYGAHQQLWKIIPPSAIYLLINQKTRCTAVARPCNRIFTFAMSRGASCWR